MPKFLSRRMIFSQIATLYDPLALISHFTVKAELHLRGVIVNNLGNGWGEPVNQFLHVKANLFAGNCLILKNVWNQQRLSGILYCWYFQTLVLKHMVLVHTCDGSCVTTHLYVY